MCLDVDTTTKINSFHFTFINLKKKLTPFEEEWFKIHHSIQILPFLLDPLELPQQQFRAQPTDIFLRNFPTTGTTWLKSLTFSILTRTSFDDSTTPLLSKLPHELVPFMELDHARFSTQRHLGVPVLATHVPYPSLPRSIIDSDCKIVYICRNPKDSFISLYHFRAKILASQNTQPINLDEAFEKFCEGECIYGPYWDHVLGYWKASLEHPDKILFLKYEEVSDDTVSYVKKLTEFIGFPLSPKEQREGMPEKIVKMCSFEKLSSLEVNKSEKSAHSDGVVKNKMYFRKGKVGD